jgi:hypothetical protein
MLQISVQEIHDWIVKTLGDICSISAMVEAYLLSRGETLMESCVHGSNQEMLQVATISDWLGWDSFVEGRVITQWLQLVTPFLAHTSPHLLAKSWACQFISRLHNHLHKQWVYCNLVIHFKGKDGLTLIDHHKMLNRMEGYSLIDPETLLPWHRFLFDTNFETLGSGPTSRRLVWLGWQTWARQLLPHN